MIRPSWNALAAFLFAFAGGVLLANCQFDFKSDGLYQCAKNSDCGGGGYVCATPSGQVGRCCLPSGSEVCDGVDNDCNGVIDDLPDSSCYGEDPALAGVGACKAGVKTCQPDGGIACVGQVFPTGETCNGIDDDCDGTIDNGFDLQNDQLNCGHCGHACSVGETCAQGACVLQTETNCADGLDNDGNGFADCKDQGCNGASCGPGCVCRLPVKAEVDCGDGVDNDGDGATDCDDSNCANQSCGSGCACAPSGGAKIETLCGDGLDNDGDGKIDCADPDCDGKACGALGCTCSGGAATETLCGDGVDNNHDGFADCADNACDGGTCLMDGGAGCQCLGGVRTETVCAVAPVASDDEDGDGAANCADPDCLGKSCNDVAGGCTCVAANGGTPMETNCGDNQDNDGDTLKDCADTDCDGQSCGAGCVCASSAKHETNCADNLDNDGDGQKDCADSDCSNQSCGAGCQCSSSAKHETNCADNQDNDGDGRTDCGDTDCQNQICNATGGRCTKVTGTWICQ